MCQECKCSCGLCGVSIEPNDMSYIAHYMNALEVHRRLEHFWSFMWWCLKCHFNGKRREWTMALNMRALNRDLREN